MTSRADALRMPEEITGWGADFWQHQGAIMWQRGHLDAEGRAALTQACLDHVRCIEGPWDAVTQFRLTDFFRNYGFGPRSRAEMAERGGTVGTQVTDPNAPDDDPEATERFMAELQRSLFRVHDGDSE